MTVVSKITSGLGNQMFQYACGLHVSRTLRSPLQLDTSWFDFFQRHAVKREFRLNQLQISGRQEYRKGISRFVLGVLAHNKPRLRRLSSAALPKFGIHLRSEQRQYCAQHDLVGPLKSSGDLFLSGYWQTANHFLANRELLLKEFTPAIPPSEGAQKFLAQICSRESFFLHVRRGDYAHFSSAMLSPGYYRKAVEALRAHGCSSPTWFVFSEDAAWCREHLGFLPNRQIVDFPSPNRDIEDLQLMAACRGGIMANSSFSWWGAALGRETSRPIVCPRFWWGTPDSDYPDLRLPSWIPVSES